MALTQEDLQAIQALLDTINARLDTMENRQTTMEQTLDAVKTSQLRVELEQYPRIAAALDGHNLNSEKLDATQKGLDDITPTVLALDIRHQTGHMK